jgi:hypothetical protein
MKTDGEESDTEGEENFSFEFPSPNDKLKIIIGESSHAFTFLSGSKRDSIIRRTRLRPYSTIRLEGVTFETHNQAKEIISKIGNSVFFQIDLITNIQFI